MNKVITALVAAAILLQGCGRSSAPNHGDGSSGVDPDAPGESLVPPFEAIKIHTVPVPSLSYTNAPTWTKDGEHLLFSGSPDPHVPGMDGAINAKVDLYIVKQDGTGLRCLTCDLTTKPTGDPLAYAMADGKRSFYGDYGNFFILECSPSLLDCDSKKLLPIDVSAARLSAGPTILNLGGGAAPHLAPDDVHFAFSDLRSDTVEVMIVGTLVREEERYVLTDPRAINPPSPSGPFDTNPIGWSNGSQVFEFKSFSKGGAAATYTAGPDSYNPDVIEVDLATGATTRLTSRPDWDEDNAPSPNGNSLVVYSFRGMHRVDALGLLPARSFIDLPVYAAGAIYYVGSEEARKCILQPWLFADSGDADGALMGQPLHPYTGDDVVHGGDNISGTPVWSPDGTKVALAIASDDTLRGPPYLQYAQLTRPPTKPLPVVSSQPGDWAVAPEDYRGAFQSNQPVLVNGLASGTALITYAGLGLVAGINSVTYIGYSDDGKNFINGTDTIINTIGLSATGISPGVVNFRTNLTLSGEHTGSRVGNLTATVGAGSGNNSESGATFTGSVTSTFDGATFTGPSPSPIECRDALPRPHPLAFTTSVSGNQLRVNVTSSIVGAGRTQAQIDKRPVWGAIVTINGQTARTNRNGDAALNIRGNFEGATITVTAGDTMVPTNGIVQLN